MPPPAVERIAIVNTDERGSVATDGHRSEVKRSTVDPLVDDAQRLVLVTDLSQSIVASSFDGHKWSVLILSSQIGEIIREITP